MRPWTLKILLESGSFGCPAHFFGW
jgi:hypothetical protein